jgi:hypothetical protein
MRIDKQAIFFVILLGLSSLAGCRIASGPASLQTPAAINERHVRQFGNFGLPQKKGAVENIGFQLPVISPDGEWMLYLRTDCETISPLTLLGGDTPAEGTLSIWIRPVSGTLTGRQLSTRRWAHSPVWSDNGRAVAYVANEPGGSVIVHVNLADSSERVLGLAGAINCLSRFDADDRTVLFCSARNLNEPFCVYRQSIDQHSPQPLSPKGMDCVLPILHDRSGRVVSGCMRGQQLNWVLADLQNASDLDPNGGFGEKSAIFQIWAGIGSPLSPDRRSFLYYDTFQNRICVCHVAERTVRRHRPETIAACWLDDQAIALATADRTFLVNNQTGMSLELFNGTWIPARYVPASRRLILFGKENSRRLSIMEVRFQDRVSGNQPGKNGVKK